MQSKNKLFGLLFGVFALCVMPYDVRANDEVIEDETIVSWDGYDKSSDDLDVSVADAVSAQSVANYNVDGSIFQQITDLEQEKVLMELEKERAQLDLDLDRLAAEKIKLQMEMETLSGRAEQEQQILQNEKSRLEAEAAKIEQEKRMLAVVAEETYDNVKESISTKAAKPAKTAAKKPVRSDDEDEEDISTMYKLVNVMGAGNQLQATLSDLETGQTKRVSVGKVINGFTVKSISLEDGVVFSKDGQTQNLNISSR